MTAPQWKELVRKLEEQGHQSEYLDRLRARMGTSWSSPENLEAELREEMANALGRAEDKVLAALLQLEVLDREVAAVGAAVARGAATRADLEARVAAFNAQREVALRARLDLMIHREAVGFRRHEGFEANYPVPPRRVAAS